MICKRTTSQHPDFIQLVQYLDAELAERDGDEHAFYHQFNSIDSLQHCIVLYEGSEAVGCGAIKTYDHTTVEVKRMYVTNTQRGKGLATQVLMHLEAWATELGFQRCVLETGIRQPEAIALYKKMDIIKFLITVNI
ncbi:N-acetyltransferase [Dokdonia pacifica]|uniref:Acetyltransferase (GNAT) family protein n=1 Tax=Dokdonia pacifica TaxID=1627892 RepID=A0A238YPX4_9FLAO|nr:N-acetyltransferase [Dokdonia pacifica]SNR72643.1 Acetyltransferase (GNAT) family protein [Dokdonia pacifica]